MQGSEEQWVAQPTTGMIWYLAWLRMFGIKDKK